MLKRSFVHALPFVAVTLVALYPVVGLAATNADEIALRSALRPLIASVAMAILLLLLTRLITRDWGKAALISSAVLLLFFSYGHLYQSIKSAELLGFVIGRHRYLLLASVASIVIWAWIVIRALRNVPVWVSGLTIAATAAVAYPLILLVARSVETRSAVMSREPGGGVEVIGKSAVGRDIYYIVLDGYGGEDVLSRVYDLDNSEFIDSLESKGFYIADESQSNYIQTALSLASSLNLDYVNDLSDLLGENSFNRGPLNTRIHENYVMNFLEQNDYRLVTFNTGLDATSIENVDVYLPSEDNPHFRSSVPETWLLNPFEGLLLETTAISALMDLATQFRASYFETVVDPLYEVHRGRITYTLDTLSQAANMPGDVFVFAHVVAPHPPFVFGPEGEPVNPDIPYGLFDGNDFKSVGGTTDEYIAGYRDELIYLNTLLEDTITKILANSSPAPIIILQSDHGPGAYLNWDSPSDSDLEERTSILNAYYLPDGGTESLYPSITPVNSFRVIFNHYFDGDFPLLDDATYFSPSVKPYLFTTVD